MKRSGAVVAVATLVFGAGAAQAQVIDDFESDAPDPWTFSNGAEFPGAEGGLAAGEGYEGQGAVLSFDFTGGGQYVAMTRELSGIRAGETLAMWVRADPRVRLTFRVTDSTGQTVQYRPHRPFESIVCDDWCELLFSPSTQRFDYWGGASDGVLRDDIVSFGVLVGTDDNSPLSGEVGIDDFALVSIDQVAIDPTAPGQALDPSFGDLFTRWGAAVHRMSDQNLDALQQLGMTWVRTDMWWNAVEQEPGVYDFAQWDQELAALESRGMRGLFLLNYGNDLYGGGPPTTPEAIDAYGDYAQAAAEFFAGRDVVFELWNEPDGPNFWPPGNRPLEYAALLDSAVDRIRAGDPNARISSGGVSWFFWEFFDAVLETGAADGVDYFAFHAYGSEPPEREVGDVVRLRLMLDDHLSSPPPVINTEWGFSAYGLGPDGHTSEARERQAVLAVRSQLANWTSGLPIAIWYDVEDDCDNADDNECNFGLLDASGDEKPALRAMRQLSSVARGRRLTSVLSQAAGPRIVRIEGSDDAVIAVWLSEPDTEVTIVAPEPIAAQDLYGQPLGGPGGDLNLTLREADGPIYLHYGSTGSSGAAGAGGAGGGDAGAGAAAAAGTSGSDAGTGAAGTGGTSASDAGTGAGATGGTSGSDGGTSGAAAAGASGSDAGMSAAGTGNTGGIDGGGAGAAGSGASGASEDSSSETGSDCGCRVPCSRSRSDSALVLWATLAVLCRCRRGRSNGRASPAGPTAPVS